LKSYPRYVTLGFQPFDPAELAKETEKILCKGDARKYTDFYATGVYGGIATGYTCGCCLRCVFCWVDWSRDFPERYGHFYSAEEAFGRLKDAARRFNVRKLRISGAEPTLGKEHLLGLLAHVESSEFDLFILETNGILLGADRDYVKDLSRFKAIRNLLDSGVSFHVAAMSADPRIMGEKEREALILKLADIDPELALKLEEEVVDPYKTTLARLEYAGLNLRGPLRHIYPPVKLPGEGEFLRRRLGRYSYLH